MALPTLNATFASSASLPRRQALAKWLFKVAGGAGAKEYYTLPEQQIWAKIAVASGAPRTESAYVSLPKRYILRDIYNAVAGAAIPHVDWSEREALARIAAAYSGDTGNDAIVSTYQNWPWRYQLAAITQNIPWTPKLMDTRFWYDAADASTIILGSGTTDRVAQWNDKSGNGYNLTVVDRNGSSAGLQRPYTNRRTVGGLNVVEWTGDNCLANFSFTHDQAATPLNIAMVLRIDGGSQHFILAGRTTTTNGTRLSARSSTFSQWEIIGGSGGAFDLVVGTQSVSRQQAYALTATFNGPNSGWRVDGAPATYTPNKNIGTNSFTCLQLGHNETEGQDLIGYIAEMVAFTDNTKREIVEGYLFWKWSGGTQLVTKAPENHPYKYARP